MGGTANPGSPVGGGWGLHGALLLGRDTSPLGPGPDYLLTLSPRIAVAPFSILRPSGSGGSLRRSLEEGRGGSLTRRARMWVRRNSEGYGRRWTAPAHPAEVGYPSEVVPNREAKFLGFDSSPDSVPLGPEHYLVVGRCVFPVWH